VLGVEAGIDGDLAVEGERHHEYLPVTASPRPDSRPTGEDRSLP